MTWKQIPVFDGRFYVNEVGEVLNSSTNHILKPRINNKGYKSIEMKCNNERIRKFDHRLVASAFIPNPNNYPIVLHLDNNPLNCSVENLKWGTYRQNNQQAVRDGRMKVPKPDNKKIYKIENDNFTFYCNGLKTLSELSGNSESAIRSHIFRNTSIKNGYMKNCKVSLVK